MFSGAQVSLHPMSDRFIEVILSGVDGLKAYDGRIERRTDDLSTELIGPADLLFPAIRDLFAPTARSGLHGVLHATVSRGCPGEPDSGLCRTESLERVWTQPFEERRAAALALVRGADETGLRVAAQLSLYPLGTGDHMTAIVDAIALLKDSGLYAGAKHFCSTLRGDLGAVTTALQAVFLHLTPPASHTVLHFQLSANSPTGT